MPYTPEIKCKFGNSRCLCQWCEDQCNNGLECHECDMNGKAMHDCYMCTGFVGTYPTGTHSDEVHRKALELLEQRGI